MRTIFFTIALALSANIYAQEAPPDTEIYLVTVQNHGNHWHFGQPQNITGREGYDNQPFFLPDNSGILYTSIRDGQADIYKYSFSDRTTTQITNTPESEYSPVLLPDGKNISVVQVEKDEKTQRIWQFDLTGGKKEVYLPKTKNVGYYTWMEGNDVALFLLGDSFDLYTGNVKSGKVKLLDRNIGRNIQRVPGENAVSYVSKKDTNTWVIQKYNFDTKETSTIISTLPGVEDYAWMPDGSMMLGKEGILYHFVPGRDKSWKAVHDFSRTEVKDFYRIAVSPDGKYIALVAYKGDKP